MGGSIEPSTLIKYKSGLNKFNVFLGQSGVVFPLPSCSSSSELRSLISQSGVIEAFICFCFKGDLTRRTTESYIDALRYFATDLGGIPFFPGEAIIARLLSGYQKLGKRPSPLKCGIDVLLLRRLVTHVDHMNLKADKALWKAMFIIAFFGCFRVSEFLVSKDELKLLSFNRVRLVGDSMEFILKKSKNNSSGQAQQILFAPLPGDLACPVQALRAFISVRCSSKSSAAFFIDSKGVPIIASRFTLVLRKALSGLGILEPLSYSSKSFRVGAASMCYSMNMSNEDIQALGRWASLAFLYYVRSGARAIRAREVQKKLASVL